MKSVEKSSARHPRWSRWLRSFSQADEVGRGVMRGDGTAVIVERGRKDMRPGSPSPRMVMVLKAITFFLKSRCWVLLNRAGSSHLVVEAEGQGRGERRGKAEERGGVEGEEEREKEVMEVEEEGGKWKKREREMIEVKEEGGKWKTRESEVMEVEEEGGWWKKKEKVGGDDGGVGERGERR